MAIERMYSGTARPSKTQPSRVNPGKLSPGKGPPSWLSDPVLDVLLDGVPAKIESIPVDPRNPRRSGYVADLIALIDAGAGQVRSGPRRQLEGEGEK